MRTPAHDDLELRELQRLGMDGDRIAPQKRPKALARLGRGPCDQGPVGPRIWFESVETSGPMGSWPYASLRRGTLPTSFLQRLVTLRHRSCFVTWRCAKDV